MSLATRLRKLREDKDLSLDELAARAGISKTYLWELERDTAGTKKPSADVLLRIAAALSTTLADLLSLATVTIQQAPVELPPSLKAFQNRMTAQQTPLTPEDLRDLAVMKFRGGQPQSADEWHQLYLLLVNSTRRRKS
jgi:transcriptional regulator with XRE-family HTH domain